MAGPGGRSGLGDLVDPRLERRVDAREEQGHLPTVGQQTARRKPDALPPAPRSALVVACCGAGQTLGGRVDDGEPGSALSRALRAPGRRSTSSASFVAAANSSPRGSSGLPPSCADERRAPPRLGARLSSTACALIPPEPEGVDGGASWRCCVGPRLFGARFAESACAPSASFGSSQRPGWAPPRSWSASAALMNPAIPLSHRVSHSSTSRCPRPPAARPSHRRRCSPRSRAPPRRPPGVARAVRLKEAEGLRARARPVATRVRLRAPALGPEAP